MPTTLISFLGAGNENRNYKTANYHLNGFEYETSFISDFFLRKLQPDQLILIGTVNSMWEEAYNKLSTAFDCFDEAIYEEIFDYVQTTTYEDKIEEPACFSHFSSCTGPDRKIVPILIKYGLDEQELMQNTEKLLTIRDHIQQEDDLYIDITHSFRSIPFFSFVLIQYLHEVIGTDVEDIYYGMLEATKELGYTPVVSLKSLEQTFEWIKAVHAFDHYGSTWELATMLKRTDAPKELVHHMQDWAYAQQLNDTQALNQTAKNYLGNLRSLELSSDSLAPMRLLMDNLKAFPQRIVKEPREWKRLLMLADKHYHSDQLALSILNAWEALISRFEQIFGIRVQDHHFYYSTLSKIIRGDKDSGTAQYLQAIDKQFKHYTRQLSDYRNAVAHGDKLSEEPAKVKQDLGLTLDYLQSTLENEQWDTLNRKIDINKFL